MNSPIIVANYKSYITSLKNFYSLQDNIWSKLEKDKYKYQVALPSSLINMVKREEYVGFTVGAQNLEAITDGPHTGSNNIDNLVSAGAEFIILGHSEIRSNFVETSDVVSKKADTCLRRNLKTIICVGEAERNEEDHDGEYLFEIKKMLSDSLAGIDKKLVKNLIIAYEPVWAVGSVAAATPDKVLEVCIMIRRHLSSIYGIDNAKFIKIIYGGSVDASNAINFITEGTCDGVLVGRACMDALEFSSIVNSLYLEAK